MHTSEISKGKCTSLKAESLLSRPNSQECGIEDENKVDRATCSYENLSERFRLKERSFGRQYSQFYAVRLMAMRKKLAAAARRKWGNSLPIKKLTELKLEEKCCIIGTLFKKMELKPCVLKEMSAEQNLLLQPSRVNYASDDDFMVLEDECERVVLTGNIEVGTSISGTIMALSGRTSDDGKFVVEDSCTSGLPYQVAPDLDQDIAEGNDRFLVLVSGLGFGEESQDMLSLQLLSDLITGELGSLQDQESCGKVVRVIVAGNSLSKCTQTKESEKKAKYLTRNLTAGTVSAVKSLDEFLQQLASCVAVDVMPGEFDPTNHALPQQPLHRCMFPEAIAYPTMQSVTNPYEAVIGGIRVLGTSGQNVSDISKVTTFDNSMDILEQNMVCSHLAPTAPDTLDCYPYADQDPFILEKCPHVYFASNQPSYQSKVLTGDNKQRVLLVAVPAFATSKTCALINLRTLTCQPLKVSSTIAGSRENGHEDKTEGEPMES
ncbi:DNA polymerase delta subunit 2 [Nematostella vectensis]|uniref:DNA polymerase delta subunit 2 n=1 Tax=Nematostella vectensis TaxID=45351 RepID=UPI002076E86F|nr:DNA polymerase delta subunit 2 [Nematostella vectensis]